MGADIVHVASDAVEGIEAIPEPIHVKAKCVDGNNAVAHVAYYFSEAAPIYPITPSSPMGEFVDSWSAHGMLNLYGQPVSVTEMQSEGGAAGAFHGLATAGTLVSSYTCSQGLLLMLPNMFKIAGELLPMVLHVSARALAGQGLSIFGEHSDVMMCRQTGFALLSSASVQEAHDLAIVSHIASLKSSVPFVHFFDGFRTSHEMMSVELLPYESMRLLVPWDDIARFKARGLNPHKPMARGTAQGPDIFMQSVEAGNVWHEAVPALVKEAMDAVALATGRKYHLFERYGAEDATDVVVVMGSAVSTVKTAVEWLNNNSASLPESSGLKGRKFAVVVVRLYSPWAADVFMEVMPATAQRVTVLDRCKVPGGTGEPLFCDVSTVLAQSDLMRKAGESFRLLGGRFGLGSKEFSPDDAISVFANAGAAAPKQRFSVGINDDVTFQSINRPPWLTEMKPASWVPSDVCECVFWGLGADGTVGANKEAAKLIGAQNKFCQAYFDYDAKKSGGRTLSHLRFGPKPFEATFMITPDSADYVAVHSQPYVLTYNTKLLESAKPGGIFLFATTWSNEEIIANIPHAVRAEIVRKKLRFYAIDSLAIARKAGLGRRVNMVLQTVFFSLAPHLDGTQLIKNLRESVERIYKTKGQKIISANIAAIDGALAGLRQIDYSNTDTFLAKSASDPLEAFERRSKATDPSFVRNVVRPALSMTADSLPVSAFQPDGSWPLGTTQFEKRDIALNVPELLPDKCVQCNYCSVVCPHACIRPFVMNEEEWAAAPAGLKENARPLTHPDPSVVSRGLRYKVQVSPLDCTGCTLCSEMCPENALVMRATGTPEVAALIAKEKESWEYAIKLPTHNDLFHRATLKGAMMHQPLLEFSGACEGCGETPYVKALTQLFGERLMIANATGCSSIWGASTPAVAYTTRPDGRGPSWANSLFEDNAEFGLGQMNAVQATTAILVRDVRTLLRVADTAPTAITAGAALSGLNDKEVHDILGALERWLVVRSSEQMPEMQRADRMDAIFVEISGLLAKVSETLPHRWSEFLVEDKADASEASAERVARLLKRVAERRTLLSRVANWIIGGDGWAFDIGFGGLDHTLASGSNIKVLVLDTEVYSNTGGQASKATPRGAVAKFAEGMKRQGRKDLGEIMMTYGSVYVASICLEANPHQAIKALVEAQAYEGPALVMAYAPCIAMGFNMAKSIQHCQLAVGSGYWPLYRFNPMLKEAGHNPFQLDCQKVSASLHKFLEGQTRFSSAVTQHKKAEAATKAEHDLDAGAEASERLRLHIEAEKLSASDVTSKLGADVAELVKARHSHVKRYATKDALEAADPYTDGIIVLYGTETGNAEEVALQYALQLKSRGVPAIVTALDDVDLHTLTQAKRMVIFCSTAGQGAFPATARQFWRAISADHDMGPDFFKRTEFCVFGLGDSRYFSFCSAAKKIDVRLEELGAVRVAPSMFGDDVDEGGYHAGLSQWRPVAAQAFNLPPLPPPDATRAPPELFQARLLTHTTTPPAFVPYGHVPLKLVDQHLQTNRKDRIVTYYRFEAKSAVNAQPFHYRLGDSLCVYPSSPTPVVDAALKLFGLSGNEVIALEPTALVKGSVSAQVPEVTSTRIIFERVVDLCCAPPQSFFSAMAPFAKDPVERTRLQWLGGDVGDAVMAKSDPKVAADLAAAQAKAGDTPLAEDALALIARRQMNDDFVPLVEALAMFKSAIPSAQTLLRQRRDDETGKIEMHIGDVVGMLPLMKPRAYSIASSPTATPDHIDLTVGLVDWQRSSQPSKTLGLCTGYMLPATTGGDMACSLRASGIPGDMIDANPEMPLVCVALGTGLAPMRAIVQHRAWQRAQGKKIGDIFLVYGAQHAATDWTFGEDFEQWAKDGVITVLEKAWSRDQAKKIYVHDRIRENAKAVFDILVPGQGMMLLCGGSRNIPEGVKKALTDAIIAGGNMSKVDAESTVRNIGLAGKYIVEAWG